jgi:hypothetical protein
MFPLMEFDSKNQSGIGAKESKESEYAGSIPATTNPEVSWADEVDWRSIGSGKDPFSSRQPAVAKMKRIRIRIRYGSFEQNPCMASPDDFVENTQSDLLVLNIPVFSFFSKLFLKPPFHMELSFSLFFI